jgi:hypothetical protein
MLSEMIHEDIYIKTVINLCVPFRESSAEEELFVTKISTFGL